MLETPKETTVLLTEKSVELDNQQATSRVAGLYLGEGHFILTKRPRSNGKWDIETQVGFTNTDPSLVDLVCSFLEKYGIGHHIGTTNPTCYQIRVNRHEEIKKVLDVLLPYLYGRKLAEARILYRYVVKSIDKRNKPIERIKGSGKLSGLKKWREQRSFDEEDLAMCDAKSSLKESSETIRVPRCYEKHCYLPHREDIVQA